MTSTIEAQGSCLCKKVIIKAKPMSLQVCACHCNMCRKWSGGPLLVLDCNQEIAFSGEEHISVFDSSEWAERGFCSRCGSNLFYRLKDNGQTFIPADLFEQHDEFHFSHQIFIDEKPAYYCFANDTENMTGEEVFAEFTNNTQ